MNGSPWNASWFKNRLMPASEIVPIQYARGDRRDYPPLLTVIDMDCLDAITDLIGIDHANKIFLLHPVESNHSPPHGHGTCRYRTQVVRSIQFTIDERKVFKVSSQVFLPCPAVFSISSFVTFGLAIFVRDLNAWTTRSNPACSSPSVGVPGCMTTPVRASRSQRSHSSARAASIWHEDREWVRQD